MASPAVTYNFTNGTTADADQVDQNFTDIINGITDGTKDLSISALTCAGAVTLNGNVTLGNGTPDDITVTGSLASSIPIKTTNSFDIGSSTLGLRSIYFGSSGGAFSTRLIGGAAASSYTITLPASGPSVTGKTIISDASAGLSFRYAEKFTGSKTSAYTATGDETIIPVDTSGGAFTVTLPAAASYAGKQLTIVKTSTDFNACTIDGDGSETINGSATTSINTQYESLTIACDGSNWYIRQRYIPSEWASYTPTISGFGTVTSLAAFWRREGDSARVRCYFVAGTVAASDAKITLPGGTSIDTNKLTTAQSAYLGVFFSNVTTTGTAFPATTRGPFVITTKIGDTDELFFAVAVDKDDVVFRPDQGTVVGTTSASVVIEFSVPISGWKG